MRNMVSHSTIHHAGRDGIHITGAEHLIQFGAIQYDQPAWKPGHDFDDPPDPVYEPAKTPLRNHLRNAAFEYNRYYEEAGLEANPLIYWKKTGTAQAGIHLFPGFNFPHADERNSIHGNSLKLSGGNGGVEQVVEGLSPNTSYYFSGYVRHPDEVNVEFSVTGKSGSKVTKTSDHAIRAENSPWRFVILKYTTGPTENSTKVSITKEGQGDVYVDDTGFVPAAWLKHINIPDTEAKIQVRKIY